MKQIGIKVMGAGMTLLLLGGCAAESADMKGPSPATWCNSVAVGA